MATPIPANRADFTLAELLEITGGTLLQKGPAPSVQGVCTDTRRLAQGNLFVALQGATVDGHEHLSAAVQAGAFALLVSRPVPVQAPVTVIQVPDTLRALGQLGRAHRRAWAASRRAQGKDALVVAVTGSAGKTTSCRAITAALQGLAPAQVHSAVGNLNNAIGVPMVLLGLGPEHAYAVVEVGTNQPGEIAYGAALAEPDIALLTLVACAHTEGLGTIEAVAEEKGALFEAPTEHGACIANCDDALVRGQLGRARARTRLCYGFGPEAQVRVVHQVFEGTEAQTLTLSVHFESLHQELTLRVPLLGNAGAYACAAALAVALAAGASGESLSRVAQALSQIQAEAGRLRPRLLPSGLLLIDDAYNANPASMADSLGFAQKLAVQQKRRLMLVLGEMRELGAQSVVQHKMLGQKAHQSGAAHLVAVGQQARITAQSATALGLTSQHAADSRAAIPLVLEALRPGDLVLVKGSRGVALERVIDAMEQYRGATSE